MRNAAIPLLREGDRLDSREFLRRWEAMPDLEHAELIDGVVFLMPSPLGLDHGEIHFRMIGWLNYYSDATPGCRGGDAVTWVMGPADVPQPDITLSIMPEFGGQSSESGKYGAGAPELIVEVSGSTTSRDLGVKLQLYQRVGVREYLSVLLNPRKIIWRELQGERYREIPPDPDGLIRSRVFPGLWLDPEAVWDPMKPVGKAVDKGIATEEHAAFVRRLAAARQKA